VAATAAAASASVVKYNSLMGVVAPTAAARARDNSLLTNSSVSTASSSAGAASAVRHDSLMNSAPAAVKELENSHKSLAPAIKQSADHQMHWNKVANEGHAAVRGLAGSLGTLWITYGSLAPLLAGAALGSAFVQAAKAGSEFAYQLTFVKALSQETSGAVEMLGRSTLNLAKSSLQGPNDIASGYRILAQAGLDVTSSIAAMPHVLHLATVGEMEMEQSAVTLVGVMNAFGLSIGNVEHVGDVFAKAAALSQTSVQSMTQAMKTASVVGEQYGASLEDTATAITLLAKVNITGTAAGTAYRNMLKELYSPVPAAAEAFKRLGIQTQDTAGNMKPFADVVFDLKDKLESFNKGDQVKILQRLFGERGAKEAIAMMALTKDKWIELRDAINNSEGFMSGVAKELEDTAKGRWAQAINTMKSSLISAFSEMEPAFKSLADSFKNLFSDESFTNSLKQIVSGMLTLTKTAIDLTPTLITLAEAYVVLKTAMIGATLWTAASTAISGYTAALLAASGAMGPVIKGTTVASTVLASLPAGFAALLSPMGLVVGGLAAAGLAFYLFRDRTAEAMESSAEKVRNFAAEAKVLLEEVARSIHVSSVAMSQSRLAAVQTALVASNETLDESAKLYIKQYVGKNKMAGVNAAVEAAAAYVRDATSTNSTGEVYTKEDAQYKAARALIDTAKATREQQSKFYAVQADVEYKATGEANQAALAAANKPATTKRSADDILGKEVKAGGSNRGELKDLRSILNDNLASGLKQEQIQLGREIIDIETQLAAQSISSSIATERKNAATRASLEIERMWIEQSLKDAKTADDKVQITKFQNDLLENALKIEKQEQQTLLDLTKNRTADNNAITDSIIASSRYVDDLKFEQEALGKTALEVANLRNQRELDRSKQDLNLQVGRNQINPDVASEKERAAQAKFDAQSADVAYQESFVGGWMRAFKSYNDAATSSAEMGKAVFDNASKSMEDSLTAFVTTGKLGFKSLTTTILAEVARMMARKGVASLLQMVAGFAFGGGGQGYQIPGSGAGAPVYGGDLVNAKGNVFSGSPSLHAYANTVQSSPKTFAFQNLHGFARGGVFGEAGPEAVMPLSRDSQGRLGVKAQGGGGDVSISIVVNEADGSVMTQSKGEKTDAWGAIASRVRGMILEELNTQKRPGGALYA